MKNERVHLKKIENQNLEKATNKLNINCHVHVYITNCFWNESTNGLLESNSSLNFRFLYAITTLPAFIMWWRDVRLVFLVIHFPFYRFVVKCGYSAKPKFLVWMLMSSIVVRFKCVPRSVNKIYVFLLYFLPGYWFHSHT